VTVSVDGAIDAVPAPADSGVRLVDAPVGTYRIAVPSGRLAKNGSFTRADLRSHRGDDARTRILATRDNASWFMFITPSPYPQPNPCEP
jgi:hypothetical protein